MRIRAAANRRDARREDQAGRGAEAWVFTHSKARAEQEAGLPALAVGHAMLAVYESRGSPLRAGGLMGYGGSLTEAYRLAGVHAARILKGEKPGELPVRQSAKVELFLKFITGAF